MAPRHVLFVTIDTLRADHLSCMGCPRPTTPKLDALYRSEGLLFSQAYSQAPHTAGSVPSFMTSTYPLMYGGEGRIDTKGLTIAECLKARGFVTAGRDFRITRVGYWLRRFKLDELPQLFNVITGEMSLVGPRPEVRRYVELFHHDYEAILQVRPGITDLASLKYRDEADILGQFHNPEEAYVNCILPDKIRLAKEYLNRSSFFFDLQLILKTLLRLVEKDSAQSA